MTSRAELEEQTWRELRALVLERFDRRAQLAETIGLSYLRVKALRIAAEGSLTMRTLAVELGTDASYTTLIVDDLEEQGLVVRTTLPDDRRMKAVSVTRAGRRLARRGDKILNDPPPALGELSLRELTALHRTVSRLLAEE